MDQIDWRSQSGDGVLMSEENIWKLCENIADSYPNQLQHCYVVFISNDDEKIPLWEQKSGAEKRNGLVIWDYHVILIYFAGDSEVASLVFDFDTRLDFPCTLKDYSKHTFNLEIILKEEYCRKFRVVSAASYLKLFSSDRSRMRKPDGTWFEAPPSYPCILNDDGSDTLTEFISMKENELYGQVLQQNELLDKFLAR